MKVTIILKGRTDKLGKQPIQIRVHSGEKRRFYPTGIKILPAQWDEATSQVKNTHPDYKLINQKLRLQVFQHEAGAYRDKPKAAAVLFKAYAYQCLHEWDKTKRATTLRAQKNKVDLIDAYAPGLLLSEITPAWCKAWQTQLYRQGNAPNTIWTKFTLLHTIVAKAMKEGVIENNPFESFQMPLYRNPKRGYLTEAQIEAVKAVGLDKMQQPLIRNCALWFVIGCYTGLRYGDMAAFKQHINIKAGRLVVETEKQKEMVGFELTGEVLALFEAVHYKAVGVTNETFNRMLKEIAAFANIKERLTVHAARHSFATLALSKGIPIEYVQKMMGHQDLKTTQIYAKIMDKNLDEQYKKLWKAG